MAQKTGIWLVGARGGVATTAILGLLALRKGLTGTTGLVSELPALAGAGLLDWDDAVIGGHDVRRGTLLESAAALKLPPSLVDACRDDLAEADRRIQPGVLFQSGPAVDAMADSSQAKQFASPRDAVRAIQADLAEFKRAENLKRVVVVLLTSTEPPTDESRLPTTWEMLKPLLDTPEECPLRASSLYAIAALESGHSFVNFTPSLGASCQAIDDLAKKSGAPHAGRDGKTGETLLKTVLAPMFASRNLEVMSWVGHNILGNADGQVLSSPEHKESKVLTKDASLSALLGYDPQSLVSIEYIPSLGERKTAWNHVHFRGFLGEEMTLQLTWGGHDSALAAPLVLDMARLMNASAARGESGAVGALACFFKTPFGRPLEDHQSQFRALVEHYA